MDTAGRRGNSVHETNVRVQRNVDIVESRCNRPQLSTRQDDDDDERVNLEAILSQAIKIVQVQ